MFYPNPEKSSNVVTVTQTCAWVVKSTTLLLATVVLAACSNGGSGGGDRTENSSPTLQLADGDVISSGNSIISIPAGDDTGIANVSARVLRQGRLAECQTELDESLVANTLLEACLADQPTCSVDFIPAANEIVVYPPPLYAPIGLEYELSLVDRDGTATDPIKAVFCFDVGPNAAPLTATDTYQLMYPEIIQKRGVVYNDRCEKQPGSEGVLANDDDDEHVSNSCLTAELVEPPRFASPTFAQNFRADGGFRYEGVSGTPTSDSFTYRVSDGVNPPSAPVTVNIVFSGDNSAPSAADDSFSISEDGGSLVLNVLDNDADPDALPLSVTSISNGPANGVANIRNGVVIDYQPNADFSGSDQFRYTTTDSGGLTATANVNITVTAVNDAPNAQNDSANTDENTPVEFIVVNNDTDPEGDTLTVSSVANPLHGTAVVAGSGSVLYTPDTNYSGTDSFEYTISDGNGGSDTATAVVTIRFVNVNPVANEDTLFVEEGQSATIDVTANDTDGDGDSLEVVEVSLPEHGVAEIVSASSISYTPAGDYNGSDMFSYRVSDGVVDAWAQVSVTVGAVNDLPVANADTAATSENSAITIDVLANDADPDGDQLEVSATTAPGNGQLSLAGANIIYTPNAGFSGTDTFSYTASDGNGGESIAAVTVQVSDVNFAPSANDDSVATPQDNAIRIDVLANDTDADGDALTLSILSPPSSGSAVVSDAAIIYTPSAGFDGPDAFRYQIADAAGETASAQVSITVSDVNAAPQATDDNVSTSENTPVSIDVLSNDSDPDGDTLALSIVEAPTNGSAVVSDAAIVYTPNAGFDGTDVFRYQVADGAGETSSAVVSITVSNVNTAPQAVADSVGTNENTPVSISVLDNDTDADGDVLSISAVGEAENGTVALNGTAIVYTPAADFSGADQFTYQIADTSGATGGGIVTITVSSVNLPPVAVDDERSNEQGDPLRIDVLQNDSDPDGDELMIVSLTQPDNGTATIANDRVIYRPEASFAGENSFQYTIADSSNAQATATVTITVVSINGAPLAVADSSATSENTAVSIDVLGNDSDPDGDTLTITSVTQPDNGAASIVDGAVLYQPAESFVGTDTFQYQIADAGGAVASAEISVAVSGVNVDPQAVDDAMVTTENTVVSIDVLLNDSDADGDALEIIAVTAAENGTTSFSGSLVSYTPLEGFSGTDSFQYTITDGNEGSATANVSVDIGSVNVAPVATDDAGNTIEGVAVDIVVLDNDTDADDDALAIVSVGDAINGTVEINGSLINYSPDEGFVGRDTFVYTVSDGDATDTATVVVDVESIAPVPDTTTDSSPPPLADPVASLPAQVAQDPVEPPQAAEVTDPVVSSQPPALAISNSGNTPPVAVDDSVSVSSGGRSNIRVLDNDSDADGDELTVTVLAVPANGTVDVRPNRRIRYISTGGFTGVDTFSYTVDDSNGGTDSATVTVTVTP